MLRIYNNKVYNRITIIDSIMGSGKTSWAIQMMKEAPPTQNFIFITPFLSEMLLIPFRVQKLTMQGVQL